jgi:DNA primase
MKLDLAKIDVIDMLDALGIENIVEATEFEVKFSCPFSGHQHGDQNPSAYMNRENTAWFCHSCKRKGNAVTFLTEYGEISVMEASRFLKERYGGAQADPDSVSMRVELERHLKGRVQVDTPRDQPLDEILRDEYSIDWDYVRKIPRKKWIAPINYIVGRGFTFKTLADWDIGYDVLSDRITIPVCDVTGKLVGFKGRAHLPHQKPKYLVLGGEKWGFDRYHIGQHVFALDRAKGQTLIVCEGELNAIAMWQMGFTNAVAVSGSNLTRHQALLLRAHAEKLIIFFDSDQGGYDGTRVMIDTLRDYIPMSVVPDHEGDPASMDERSVRSIIDNAESVTKALLLSRS